MISLSHRDRRIVRPCTRLGACNEETISPRCNVPPYLVAARICQQESIEIRKLNFTRSRSANVRGLSMKTPEPTNNEDPLRETLKEWSVTAPLPPRFREQVWQQIDRSKVGTRMNLWTGFQRWIETTLPRPSVALAYVTILLALGVTTGLLQARSETTRLDAALGLRYVQAVDPFHAVSRHP